MHRCVLSLLVVLVLTACAPDSTPPPTPTPTPESPVSPTWTTDVPTLGNVTITDEVVLAYVAPEAGTLELHAWAIDSGEPLWHAEASPAAVTPGVALRPAVFEVDGTGYVAFVAPAPNGLHDLVVATVSDGSVVPIDGDDLRLWVTERPWPCDDVEDLPDHLCFSAITSASDGVEQSMRLDATGFTVVPDAGVSDQGRVVGPDLYATDDRGPGAEHLEYIVDGSVQWSVAYHDVFGPGYSSDNGWHWRRDEDRGLMIGIATTSRDGTTVDLTNMTTVALSLDDGSVVWRVEGFSLWCPVGADAEDVGCLYDDTVVSIPTTPPSRRSPRERSLRHVSTSTPGNPCGKSTSAHGWVPTTSTSAWHKTQTARSSPRPKPWRCSTCRTAPSRSSTGTAGRARPPCAMSTQPAASRMPT